MEENREMVADDNLQEELRAMVADILELEDDAIAPKAHLVEDLGGDSLIALELIASVEKRYGVVIPPEDYPRLVRLDTAVPLIRGLIANA